MARNDLKSFEILNDNGKIKIKKCTIKENSLLGLELLGEFERGRGKCKQKEICNLRKNLKKYMSKF